MQLTEHFSKEEFNSKDGAAMPQSALNNIKILASNLEVIRTELGGVSLNINSGYRSKAHNKKQGGKTNSQHLLGNASDLSSKHKTPKEIQLAILRLIKEGKILEGGVGIYNTFVHYDIRKTTARWDYTKDL